MSDLTPSNSSSSGAKSHSSGVASSISRPTIVREHSYTHVFPASSAGGRTIKHSSRSQARKLEIPDPAAPSTLGRNDSTRQLFNGLQWLMEMSTQPLESDQLRNARESSVPLSEKAITSHNASKHGSLDDSSEPAKTAAWVDGQIKRPAAAPF